MLFSHDCPAADWKTARMSGLEILFALLIAIGLAGILMPIVPGSLLAAAAMLAWAFDESSGRGWAVFAIAVTLIAVGAVVKYLVPGRQLQRSGVPNSTLFAGAALGLVGFFVIPVIGLPLGFVLGVYLSEWQRTTRELAWPATKAALRAVGLALVIELSFTTMAALVWFTGALST